MNRGEGQKRIRSKNIEKLQVRARSTFNNQSSSNKIYLLRYLKKNLITSWIDKMILSDVYPV